MTPEQARRAADQQILKTLMTGLIYPAVLGTVIFIDLDSVVYALRSVRESFHRHSAAVDVALVLKLAALFGTTAFYCCAYMYSSFTRNYRRLFFAYDCIFVVTLYVTVYATGLQRRAKPDLPTMTMCFVIFTALYLMWDLAERKQPSNGVDEAKLYDSIVRWEGISIAAFTVTVGSSRVDLQACKLEYSIVSPK